MSKFPFAVSALLAVSLLLPGCEQIEALIGKKDAANPAAAMMNRVVRVTTVELTPHLVNIERELTGRTVSYRWAEVRPEVNGILRERCFTEGSFVKKGDVLYRIEPDIYRAARDSALANLASAEANLAVTKLREKRIADMLKNKSVSQQDYDDIQAALKQAQAGVKACKAALESAEINLRRTEVRAPISGIITKSNFTVGALLSVSQVQALATIHQTDPIYVELSQSSDDLYSLKKQFAESSRPTDTGANKIEASLFMHDGAPYEHTGHLNFTGVDVNESTNTILLRAEFPNPNRELLPGLFVRTKVVMGSDPNGILVPQKAVLRDAKGTPYVYIIGKDKKAERRSLKISRAIGNDWHVTSGLILGERIILNGVNNVRAGAPVQEITHEDAQKAFEGRK